MTATILVVDDEPDLEALVLQKTARPGIEWTTDIPERGPVVPCDRRMLRQALTNLLQNAADAVGMRDGAGHIALTVRDLPDGVLLSVASSILFASVKLPYWLVAGPLSGFLSLIPYIGLPLALTPPLVAALPMHTGPELLLFLSVSVGTLPERTVPCTRRKPS